MKIEIVDKVSEVFSIDKIKCGELFECDGEIYMKTDSLDEGVRPIKVNAVGVASGDLFYFEEDEEIVPLNGKIVIEKSNTRH